jgi:hypothetical protein
MNLGLRANVGGNVRVDFGGNVGDNIVGAYFGANVGLQSQCRSQHRQR